LSELTREEILKLIEGNGGHEGLDLSHKDLSRIDLKALDLHKAILIRADLREAHLGGINLQGANLRRASLQLAVLGRAELPKANLGGANLREANMSSANMQLADLAAANLEMAYLGSANVRKANLTDANLQGAFLRGADLHGANLVGANLQGAILTGANLQGAHLREADCRGTRLQYSRLGKVDFFVAESLEGTHFHNAFLDDTRMKRKQLGRAIGEELEGWYDQARDAYLRLKQNFDVLGDYAASAWAYQKERQMQKACNAPWRARGIYGQTELGDTDEGRVTTWHPRVAWFYTRHTLKWLGDWFVELLCGYGESLSRVLAWMLLVILGFAACYQVSHAVVTSSQDAATSLWDHLVFSLGAFTTLQPARLQAARPGIELLTTIQAIIGIALAGLLGFVAGNRIRRS